MNGKLLRIGTRESQLAVWQATEVQKLLAAHGYPSELVYIKSEGDIDLTTPLYEIGVQGIFTRSLDIALLRGRIDLAVHSMKDIPTQFAKGIIQCAILPRASYKDLLVYKGELSIVNNELSMVNNELSMVNGKLSMANGELSDGSEKDDSNSLFTSHISHLTSHNSHLTSHISHLTSHISHLTTHNSHLTTHNSPFTIATSSIRRRAQWLHRYPNHTIENLRGNVNTRLKKVEESNWNGAIFAAAGLERIDLRPEKSIELDWMLPAPAQGAIAVVCRSEDTYTAEACNNFHNAETALCTKIERDFLRTLMGGCSTPISGLAEIIDGTVVFKGNILSVDGKEKADVELSSAISEASGLGKEAADQIFSKGGKAIAEANKQFPVFEGEIKK